MNFYLLRHAKAEDLGARDTRRDSGRVLVPAGVKRMRRAAKGMRALDLRFDVILSSPFRRARETAEIVADVFKATKKLRNVAALEPENDPEDILDYLRQFERATDDVLLVGHEPHLSRLVAALVAGGGAISLNFKKAGLCKLRGELRRGRAAASLEWFLTPRQLEQLAD
ncbi:MAG: phosphohistidine phosphatase SixA [Verrucomicrobia bacterium]|nr:phosphohistidine phosphatase SixA [Verrucomicrobiota bacterium]